MRRFNVSEWALHHRPLVLYFMIVVVAAGAIAYGRLGQSEDPPFTFKVMVIKTLWPGATAEEVEQQVTRRIERKLQETRYKDFLQSYSRPGESLIFFNIQDSAPASAVADVWYQVRKKVGDIAAQLPPGVQGPFFNDEFGDVYANIYALSGADYSYAELKDYADRIRTELLRVPDVAKVDYFGEQEERIYVEISNRRLATLGLSPRDIANALQAQNAVAPSGYIDTDSDRVRIRTSGAFRDVDSLRNLSFRVNGRLFRLGDIADVRRGYVDPPETQMRFDGKPVLGIGVSMQPGGDVIALGEHLAAAAAKIRGELPAGLQLQLVTSMPHAVSRAIDDFLEAVWEAIAIVLLVSLASLGLRTGAVVAITIPLVLAATVLFMWLFDIGLHKVSLGTLVLTLGLLVDDAIIAVEMMAVKLEQGLDRVRAASFAYTSTAFPMLTGTLITISGFLPIVLAQSSTGEYTRSIFQVSAIALLSSWVAAVVVIPYLGYKLLPEHGAADRVSLLARLQRRFALLRRLPFGGDVPHAGDIYTSPFYRRLRGAIDWCVNHRWRVLAVTVALFVLALAGFALVPQQFFPSSSRPELIVDLRLREGASFAATWEQAHRLERFLAQQPEVANYVSYVGRGSPRFYLTLDEQLPQRNFAQFVVTARDVAGREALYARLLAELHTHFSTLHTHVSRLENGPPVGFPVQFRVSGENVATVRGIAERVAAVMRDNPNIMEVQFDWDEPDSKVITLEVDQDKARLLGISSNDLAGFLQLSLAGQTATYYRERDKLIGVELIAPKDERLNLDNLESIAVPTASGQPVPLAQLVKPHYGLEPGIIWTRDRQPTITVRSELRGDAQGIDVTNAIDARLGALRAQLPPGYRVVVGGSVENNAKAQRSINVEMPIMAFAIFTLLMIQLRSFARSLLVVLTAPLGLIGVVAALLLFHKPFGFVALLGTIAMAGIIMRNSVILVDQIERDIEEGHSQRDAVIGASVRRFRPIMLTAAAAVLALIPLVRSDFFGPMAVALMGGITAATVLTLFFLPALYAAWYRLPRRLLT